MELEDLKASDKKKKINRKGVRFDEEIDLPQPRFEETKILYNPLEDLKIKKKDEDETINKFVKLDNLINPFDTFLTDKKLVEISKLHNVTLRREIYPHGLPLD
jgi:hypothetical protein